jgi:hypothetical protein
MFPVALALPVVALVLCMCLPAVKSEIAKALLQRLCWLALAAISIGAAALVTGAPVLAGWLTCGGLAALVLLAGLLSGTDPKRERLSVGQESPNGPNPSPSGVLVDWERFEADLAAWAATAVTRPGPEAPVGRESPPAR